jgi:hypothetical protein
MLRVLRHGSAIVLLTLLTQIGGLAWLLALAFRRFLPLPRRLVLLIFFAGIYAAATLVTHQVSPLFGRVPLPCFTSASLVVSTPLYCALNRNYVTPELKAAAEAHADHMASSFPGTKTLALDANFPFVTGFPLLPHLSHDDGRKLDLALYYEDRDGNFRNGETRSPLGYFAFQQPGVGALQPCANRSRFFTLRWDMNWLQALFPDWDIELARMKEALRWLSTEGHGHSVEKIFMEPHIPARLGVSSDTFRFQGCNAARHDDHIHIQVR